ncbi:MAG: selenocysteine-specific translation elongation factor, partial [Anaerolineae bacterium]|nr:selenocysteine-specific translation elongation factor [Anaerolineae bacterium]
MRHYTIATAGHVDHGKSTLVKALTGINPDRLIEEQKREMTIDLGFAYLTLPTQAKDVVGIIDVPGHIDFIENMLAGVGGIDAALLVIAADEGPMPQTREHLAILDLLKVKRGIVALTKTDLAPDPDWIPLVIEDIRALLAPTPLATAPILPVSARQGKGLKELLAELGKLLRDLPPPNDLGKPRLPIDRVFTVAGFGTVVTGTLVDGALSVGDEVAMMPKGALARVRGLQTHGKKIEQAQPGSRVAVNLTGVTLDEVRRGDTLAKPSQLTPSTRIDVQIELRDWQSGTHAPTSRLRHNTQVMLFCGAAETLATVKVLEGSEIVAGDSSGFAQLELHAPVAVGRGDRFILRLPSPSVTIGGGTGVDPQPPLRYRRRGGSVGDGGLSRLDATPEGTP